MGDVVLKLPRYERDAFSGFRYIIFPLFSCNNPVQIKENNFDMVVPTTTMY